MKYKINKADLYGNIKDGYEVNDWYGAHTVEMDIDLMTILDRELIAALVKVEYFNDIVLLPSHSYKIDYDSYADAGIVYITIRTDEYEELYKLTQLDFKFATPPEPIDHMSLIMGDIRPCESGYDYMLNQSDDMPTREE